MAFYLLLGGLSVISYLLFSRYRSLQQNISVARQSGLPYRISPVYLTEVWWMVVQGLALPLLRRLPQTWTEPWLSLSIFTEVWREGYKPFAKVGHDTFILVSSGGNIVWTCEPEVIHQLTSRGSEFIKPVEMLERLNIYGPTLTASEGEEGRLYRKITARSFNDETHSRAWIESIKTVGAMLADWNTRERGITSLQSDMSRLTLNVFSSVCFAREIEWKNAQNFSEKVPHGHTLSYSKAMSSVLSSAMTIAMTPKFLRESLPVAALRNAQQSFTEWHKYMEELRDTTQQQLKAKGGDESVNLLESIVKAGQISEISPEAVLGNIFIFAFAGHETTANTLINTLVLLACRPASQRALQAELDDVLGVRDPSDWSYKTDLPKLLDGYTGAILNETLRLYPALPFIPKTTTLSRALKLGDRDYLVPKNTLCMIHSSATHHNPKYWSEVNSSTEARSLPYPLSHFNPSMWLTNERGNSSGRGLLSTEPGSYMAFAEGYRNCIGKRFAQTEFCALMATIFKDWSVELAIEGEQTAEGYEVASRNAEQQLANFEFVMALKMVNNVPLRLVRRGEEKWTV